MPAKAYFGRNTEKFIVVDSGSRRNHNISIGANIDPRSRATINLSARPYRNFTAETDFVTEIIFVNFIRAAGDKSRRKTIILCHRAAFAPIREQRDAVNRSHVAKIAVLQKSIRRARR